MLPARRTLLGKSRYDPRSVVADILPRTFLGGSSFRGTDVYAIPAENSGLALHASKLFTIINVIIIIRITIKIFDTILEDNEIQALFSAQAEEIISLWERNMTLDLKKVTKSDTQQ